jgi:hypothetical protein
MPRLLVVHHTPSPALHEMFDAAVSGARTDEIAGNGPGNGQGVEVVVRSALTATAVDVLEADAYLLGTPVQLALGTLRGLARTMRGIGTPIIHRN